MNLYEQRMAEFRHHGPEKVRAECKALVPFLHWLDNEQLEELHAAINDIFDDRLEQRELSEM